MADLPSILGGMAQGFLDFGKGAVDLFGTGGAAVGDLVDTIRTGKVSTKNQDDFRKWLYNTDSVKDAAAKGLGTALNGVQTALDYIPGVNAFTRTPLGNAAQGALGGLADEFKTYGENYDLGRAGQRAAVSGLAAAASGSLADALKGSSNALLKSGTVQGLARGATSGAISGGGYAAIDGGDVMQSALQGAGTGALIGGATGAFQDFKPAKTYDVALTDDERAARIANAQKQIDDIGPIRLFTDDPDELAKRARVHELQDTIKAYQSGYDTVQDYNDALAARRANRQPSLTREEYEAKMQQRIRDLGGNYEVTPEKQAQFDRLQKVNPMLDDYHTGIRAPQDIATLQEAINNAKDIDPAYKAMLQKALADDSVTVYSSYPIEEGVFTTPIKQMAQDYAGPGNQVYSKTISPNDIAWIDDQEGNYIPRLQQLETTLSDADMAVNNPKLTPEQEAYFKDSVIRDENGNLKPMYHGTRSNFTVFGDNAPYDTSNSHASVGNWFTPTKEGAKNFAESIWYGDEEPRVMETYLNVKNPKIYESADNSKAVEALTKELREMELNSSKLSDTELYSKNIYDASMAQRMLEQEGKDTTVKWLSGKGYGDEKATKLIDEIADLNEQAAKKEALLDKLSELKYSDAYQRFKTDLYKVDGQTAEDANVGGTGMALNDRGSIKKYVDKLKSEGYDGIIIKGTKYDADVMGGPNDQYVVFDSNQIKDINNLKPTDAPSIMESRIAPEELDLARALSDQDLLVNSAKIAPGQLGLFDDMPTQTPKTGTRQTSLFDQPQEGVDYYGEDIEAPVTALANPYAPVDGKLTQAMKDRYWEVMKNADSFGGAIDNELYNKIDQSTLPKGYDKLRQLLDSQMGEDSKVAVELRKGIGTDIPLRADLDKLVEYVYGDEINGKQTFYKDLDESVRLNRKNAPLIGIDAEQAEADAKNNARNKLISRAIEKAERKVIDDVVGSGDSDDILYALQDYRRRGVRTGRAGALDTVLSERLGIAPGNTIKVTNVTDSDRLSSGALGRYARSERNIAVSDMNSPEGKVSTMAHERLHSFQNEARPESAGRYDPEVAEAYKQLQKDLGHYYKSNSEIKKRYKRDVDYWASSGEQESRMFQQYLENKGYTDNSAWRKMGGKADEWGNEINPAFDKFIDKLRDLSKRGIALPALTALFGGGAYMASQNNDKEKEVQ